MVKSGNDSVWTFRQPVVKAWSRERGFTLIELMMVVAILSALTVMVLPAYYEFKERARVARGKQEIRSIEMAVDAYSVDQNSYPASLADVNFGGIRDPWGNPYQYSYPPARTAIILLNPDSYDLYSNGKDGVSDDDLLAGVSQDDIVRAGEGSFVGLGSDF